MLLELHVFLHVSNIDLTAMLLTLFLLCCLMALIRDITGMDKWERGRTLWFFTRETHLKWLPFLNKPVGFGGPCSGLHFWGCNSVFEVLHMYNFYFLTSSSAGVYCSEAFLGLDNVLTVTQSVSKLFGDNRGSRKEKCRSHRHPNRQFFVISWLLQGNSVSYHICGCLSLLDCRKLNYCLISTSFPQVKKIIRL